MATKKENVKDTTSESLIKSGSKVKFHYSGRLESGESFDSSVDRDPLEFVVGNGNIIPGLEKEILKMKKGEKKTITVPAEEAYGPRNEELSREIPKGPLPQGLNLQVGAVLYLKTPDGTPFPATVAEVKEDTVVIDFNHPLAGKTLIFDIEILDISEFI